MIKIILEKTISWELVLYNSLSWGKLIIKKKYNINSNWLGLVEFIKLHNSTYTTISPDNKLITLDCLSIIQLTPDLLIAKIPNKNPIIITLVRDKIEDCLTLGFQQSKKQLGV